MSRFWQDQQIVSPTLVTSSFTKVVDLTDTDRLALECILQGSGIGTLSLLGSASGINFVTIPTSVQSATNNTVLYTLDSSVLPFRWLEVNLQMSSGNTTFSIYASSRNDTSIQS